MTIIITRLFASQSDAQSAAKRLQSKGIPRSQCDVIAAGTDAKAEMAAAMVHESAIDAYAAKLGAGAAVLAVRTTYKPLGAAKLTRTILAGRETLDAGNVTEEHFAKVIEKRSMSIMQSHPYMATLPGYGAPGLMSAAIGMRMLKPHKARRSASKTGRKMSRAFWPMPLVSKRKKKTSAMSGTRHMSRMFWPMPLLSSKPRRKSVTRDGVLMFS